MLERATRRTGFSTDSIAADLWARNSLLWVINDFEAVVVTKLVIRDKERVLWIDWIAGKNMTDWIEDWEAVQNQHAIDVGCTAVEFQGRKGWEKHNKVHTAYKPILTIYRRELGDVGRKGK